MAYDREEVVAAVTSFYKFLVNTHIPASALKWPPQDGWPELTDEWLSFMDKDATVMDLIRHLPYIQPNEDNMPQIYPYSKPIDFTGEELRDFRFHGVAEPQVDYGYKVGKSVLTLSAAEGRWIMSRRQGQQLSQKQLLSNNPEDWREQATYYVPEFFKMIKEQYRTFEVIAISKDDVEFGERLGLQQGNEKLEEVKGIYRQHEWLTENYRKYECLAAVEEAL